MEPARSRGPGLDEWERDAVLMIGGWLVGLTVAILFLLIVGPLVFL